MNYLPGIQASSRWYLHAQGSPYVLNPIPQNFSPELSLKQFQCWPFFILSRKIVEHFLVLCLPPPGDRWYVLGWYTRAVSTWILHNCCSAALCPTVSHERQCYLISLSLSLSRNTSSCNNKQQWHEITCVPNLRHNVRCSNLQNQHEVLATCIPS